MRNETAEGTLNIFHMGGTGDQICGGNAESKIQMRLVSIIYGWSILLVTTRYRVQTCTLCGPNLPETGPDITALAVTGKHPTSKFASSAQ